MTPDAQKLADVLDPLAEEIVAKLLKHEHKPAAHQVKAIIQRHLAASDLLRSLSPAPLDGEVADLVKRLRDDAGIAGTKDPVIMFEAAVLLTRLSAQVAVARKMAIEAEKMINHLDRVAYRDAAQMRLHEGHPIYDGLRALVGEQR